MKIDKRRNDFSEILELIRRNPQAGLEKLYKKYGKLMYVTAFAICRTKDKADEAVNSVLIKIWSKSNEVFKIENPAAWIYVIAANSAKDILKEKIDLPLDDRLFAERDEIQEVLDSETFSWMISDLSENEQEILIYKFVLNYTFQEIADELRKPLTTISSAYYRALIKIKEKLENK